jgi:hypothetical protein
MIRPYAHLQGFIPLQERLSSGESSPVARVAEQGSIEQEAMIDVVVTSLETLREFPNEMFKAHLKHVFPLMTRLIRCRAATVEMQVALSDLFASKLGSIV